MRQYAPARDSSLIRYLPHTPNTPDTQTGCRGCWGCGVFRSFPYYIHARVETGHVGVGRLEMGVGLVGMAGLVGVVGVGNKNSVSFGRNSRSNFRNSRSNFPKVPLFPKNSRSNFQNSRSIFQKSWSFSRKSRRFLGKMCRSVSVLRFY